MPTAAPGQEDTAATPTTLPTGSPTTQRDFEPPSSQLPPSPTSPTYSEPPSPVGSEISSSIDPGRSTVKESLLLTQLSGDIERVVFVQWTLACTTLVLLFAIVGIVATTVATEWKRLARYETATATERLRLRGRPMSPRCDSGTLAN